MNISKRSHLRSADGRGIDVHVSGPEDGEILLFHHDTPGSCLPHREVEDAAHRLGLRLVKMSRPGYGDSSRFAGRRVVDVAADSAAVLDALGAERCLVAGWSGGGPHALACGARLADRVIAVLVIAGFAPYQAEGLDFMEGMGTANVVGFGKVLEGEAVLRPYLEELRGRVNLASVVDLGKALGSRLRAVDQAVLTKEFVADWAASTREGLRGGADGWIDDDLAFVQPWGFALTEIAVPTVLWHGSEDLIAPIGHGRWLAERIPGVTAHLEEGEGHVSLWVGAMDRMLQELLAASRGHAGSKCASLA